MPEKAEHIANYNPQEIISKLTKRGFDANQIEVMARDLWCVMDEKEQDFSIYDPVLMEPENLEKVLSAADYYGRDCYYFRTAVGIVSTDEKKYHFAAFTVNGETTLRPYK